MNNNIKELPLSFVYHRELPENETFIHDSYDIIYILTGKCKITYKSEENMYPAGNICMLTPQTQYSLSAGTAGTMLHIGIDSNFVYQNLTPADTLVCDSIREPKNNYYTLKELTFSLSAKYLENPQKNNLAIRGMAYRLLAILEENYVYSILPEYATDRYANRIQTIFKYIDDHYTEPLTLSKLADALYLTPQYLSRFFKNHIHKNFRECLLEKRLFHACREIVSTDSSITDIALHCGFSNVTVFSKVFKKQYLMSPTSYRKLYEKNYLKKEYDNLHAQTTIEKTSSDVSLDDQDSFYQQHIKADVNQYTIYENNICTLINIGFVQNLLREDFLSDLLSAKKQLGFRFLRVEGIISSSFIPKVLPDYKYYFHNLDMVMDLMYSQDLIPFIELTQLPHGSNSFYDSNFTFTPRSSRFMELLEETLKHCSSVFPKSWTCQWKFELWMTPIDSPESYQKDFQKVYHLIQKYLPGAMLGGCGFSSNSNTEQLLESLFSVNWCPDFLSAHYSLQLKTSSGQYIVSTKSEYLLSKVKKDYFEIKKYFPNKPFYITEWTSIFSSDIPVHYSCFQAAFICRNVVMLLPYCELMGYWIFSDLNYPAVSHNNQPSLWGQGLIDRNHIRLPAFYAFSFFRHLGSYVINRGDNHCITRTEGQHYQCLVFNYAHLTSENAFLHEQSTSFADIYRAFETPLSQQIEFALTGVEPGTYKVTQCLLSRSYGSILDIWISSFLKSNIDETDYLMNNLFPTSDTIQYYKNSCVPQERIFYIKSDGILRLKTKVQPHDVCLFSAIRLF